VLPHALTHDPGLAVIDRETFFVQNRGGVRGEAVATASESFAAGKGREKTPFQFAFMVSELISVAVQFTINPAAQRRPADYRGSVIRIGYYIGK
jgi:hypothetical protein